MDRDLQVSVACIPQWSRTYLLARHVCCHRVKAARRKPPAFKRRLHEARSVYFVIYCRVLHFISRVRALIEGLLCPWYAINTFHSRHKKKYYNSAVLGPLTHKVLIKEECLEAKPATPPFLLRSSQVDWKLDIEDPIRLQQSIWRVTTPIEFLRIRYIPPLVPPHSLLFESRGRERDREIHLLYL